MVKIFIKVFFYLLTLFIFIIAYGFIITGYPGWLFYLIGLVVSTVYLLLVFKKELKGKEKFFIVLIVSVPLVLSCISYLELNDVLDNKLINSYKSTIFHTSGRKDYFDTGWFFIDDKGEEQFHRSYIDYYSDKYNDGDTVTVKEYEGLFKVKHYRFDKE